MALHLTKQETQAALFVAVSLFAGSLIQIFGLLPDDEGAGLQSIAVAEKPIDARPLAADLRLPGVRATTAGRKSAQPAPASINVNQASASQLEALPGIGPALAARVVSHRTKIGAFRSVNQLLDVPGIGPAKLSKLAPFITF